MGINISKEHGNLIVVTGSGTFNFSDLQAIQNAAREVFKSGAMAKYLITTTGFTGWGQDGDWGDLGIVHETDHYVSHIAVIGTEDTRDQTMMFLGAGRRKAAVKFFLPSQESEARTWLAG
jgi:hypothetical protein